MNTSGWKSNGKVSATQSNIPWRGGRGTFRAQADTWGGGTVKLQYLGPNGVDYEDMGTDTTLTADGGGNFEFPAGRLQVSIATATSVSTDFFSTE